MPRIGITRPIPPQIEYPRYGAFSAHLLAQDIQFYLSGGAANSSVAASLGGNISFNRVWSGQLNNAWANMLQSQLAGGLTSYCCVYVKNSNQHGKTWLNVVLWIDEEPTNGSLAVALDPAGLGVAESATPNPQTAPTPALTFTQPSGRAGALTIGDMVPGAIQAIWMERVIPANPSGGPDQVSIHVEGGIV